MHAIRSWLLVTAATAAAFCTAPAAAQLLDAPSGGASPGAEAASLEPITLKFRVGVEVTAKRGACRDIYAVVAVPIECPEQSVQRLEEDFTSHVAKVDFRELAGGAAKQMLVSIPFLESGDTARAAVTYEVTVRPTAPLPPGEQAELRIPERTPRNLRSYVGPSPFIESKHPKIRRLVRDIEEKLQEQHPDASDWRRVEFVYDWVLDNIEYLEGDDTSAVTTLDEESADCHGRSALFVAICRAMGVPARLVWVQNHCYPEFYMERPDGEGVWLPAESAGVRAFGEMPLARTILQKGDDFRMPERPRERMRYASDFLTGRPVPGSGKPSVKYLREVVP
ncbi:transglutaminase domain-containing protein [Botrimarina sp.]|uniref:transglutaminase-like domain-containing protein n=1 Tax=Botrimarina sp. TaxID=2795802 RepID=UPI0032EEF3C5